MRTLSYAQLEPKRVKLLHLVEKGEDQWMGSMNSQLCPPSHPHISFLGCFSVSLFPV